MSDGFIYFLKPIDCDGPIKIGCSKWPAARLISLAHWSPIELELIARVPGDFKLESFIHRKFSYCRRHKEWFHAVPELVAAIDRIKAGETALEAFSAQPKYGKSNWAREPLLRRYVEAGA